MPISTHPTHTPAFAQFAGIEAVRPDHEVVELQLLLPRWQASALDAAARSRGMTSGQILRRVIADLFVDTPTPPVDLAVEGVRR